MIGIRASFPLTTILYSSTYWKYKRINSIFPLLFALQSHLTHSNFLDQLCFQLAAQEWTNLQELLLVITSRQEEKLSLSKPIFLGTCRCLPLTLLSSTMKEWQTTVWISILSHLLTLLLCLMRWSRRNYFVPARRLRP